MHAPRAPRATRQRRAGQRSPDLFRRGSRERSTLLYRRGPRVVRDVGRAQQSAHLLGELSILRVRELWIAQLRQGRAEAGVVGPRRERAQRFQRGASRDAQGGARDAIAEGGGSRVELIDDRLAQVARHAKGSDFDRVRLEHVAGVADVPHHLHLRCGVRQSDRRLRRHRGMPVPGRDALHVRRRRVRR